MTAVVFEFYRVILCDSLVVSHQVKTQCLSLQVILIETTERSPRAQSDPRISIYADNCCVYIQAELFVHLYLIFSELSQNAVILFTNTSRFHVYHPENLPLPVCSKLPSFYSRLRFFRLISSPAERQSDRIKAIP